jgi:hypothetical protein
MLALVLILPMLRRIFKAQNSSDPLILHIRFDAAKLHLLMTLLFALGVYLDIKMA